jgi:hypothetical protein
MQRGARRVNLASTSTLPFQEKGAEVAFQRLD